MQNCKYAELDGSFYRCLGTKEKDPCQFENCMSCCTEYKPKEKSINVIAKTDLFLNGARAVLKSEGYSEKEIKERIDFALEFSKFISECGEQ